MTGLGVLFLAVVLSMEELLEGYQGPAAERGDV